MTILPIADVIAAYELGVSVADIAVAFETDPDVIIRLLLSQGVLLRYRRS